MDRNKHHIEKVFFEIDTNSLKVANSLKNNINMLINNELLVFIEQELSDFLFDENQVLQIEKLGISVENIHFQNDSIDSYSLKEEIKKQLLQKLESARNNSNSSIINGAGTDQILSQTEKESNTLIYYLTNGVMPWWVSKNDTAVFNDQNLDSFINSETFKTQFQNIIDKSIVQKRLINQFSNKQLAQITAVFTSNEFKFSNSKIINYLHQDNNFQLKESFWISMFKYLKDKNSDVIIDFYFNNIKKFEKWNLSFEKYSADLKQFAPFNDSQITIYPRKKEYFETTKPETHNYDSQKGYYVQNAGLIIIHPFIKDLFRNCHLIKEGNTIVDKELAVHILHYAATKREQDYEHNMLFEKFLCGMPIQQPIQREISICDAHKIQVEEMLQSVLEHWSALKSNSTDLLRNEFIQRDGKLDFQDNNPRLFIEKKTQDILVEKIPWNISVTKIPWIEKLIYTDW